MVLGIRSGVVGAGVGASANDCVGVTGIGVAEGNGEVGMTVGAAEAAAVSVGGVPVWIGVADGAAVGSSATLHPASRTARRMTGMYW